ncbi:MAG: PspA/IM30 family protein [Pseudomonadota bacterium]
MFKSMFALIRGKSHETAQSVVDQNAMVILRQQFRDCVDAVSNAKRALAIAMAQHDKEKRQHEDLQSRIEDLEARTLQAMERGEEDLAMKAAETIATLEAERDASQQTLQRFNAEIDRLRKVINQSEARLRELKRGQRIADVTDKTQRLRQTNPTSGLSALKDAENTLSRLQDRQLEEDAAANAYDGMSNENCPDHIAQKLSEAGCGAPIKSTADQVLERLKKQSAGKSKKSK